VNVALPFRLNFIYLRNDITVMTAFLNRIQSNKSVPHVHFSCSLIRHGLIVVISFRFLDAG